MSERFDVVIVGSGPAGLAAGVRAAQRGLSHVVLERAQLADTISRYRKGKHVMAEPSTLPTHAENALGFEASSREEVLDRWRRDLQEHAVNLRVGPEFELLKLSGRRGAFQLELRGGGALEAAHVILAVGTSGTPRPFDVPGKDLENVIYHIDDAEQHVDETIAVIGAGDSAIEDALALAEGDCDVTLVQRREGFDRAKAANRIAIENAIRAGDVSQLTHTTVGRIEPGAVVLRTGELERVVECDWVLGRLGSLQPRAFLESLGIEFESDHPEAPPCASESYESSVPGVYLVGSLRGRDLIKCCINEGFEVIEHIVGEDVASALEPMIRQRMAALAPGVAEAIEQIRAWVPLYAGLGRLRLEELLVESHVRVIAAGETVYRRGDHSDTFFTVLEGRVWVSPGVHDDAEKSRERWDPFAIQHGEFFGEDSLLSGRHRGEHVTAASDCVLLESSRVALVGLIHAEPEIRKAIDAAWLRRKLQRLLPFVSNAALDPLVAGADVRRLKPGEVLFAEGDVFDGLHLIRRGSLVVSRRRSGDDRVVNYVPAGGHVGEFGLIDPKRRRSATVTANVETEALRIPADLLDALLGERSPLHADLELSWRKRLAHDARMLAEPAFGEMMGFFIAKGGKEATDLLVIDEELCVRCDNCETACAATHGGVSRLDRDGGPRFAGLHLPTACQHCENPLCMTDCPPNAIQRDPQGEILIAETCIGCGNCAGFCPYGVIKMEVERPARPSSPFWSILFGARPRVRGRAKGGDAHEVAVKCDRCRDLVRVDPEAGAACVAACPTGAILRVKPLDFVERLLRELPRRVEDDQPIEAIVASRGRARSSEDAGDLGARADELLELAKRVQGGERDSWARLITSLQSMESLLGSSDSERRRR